MEHPDWPAFLSAIVADPDDDTARLVAADFLEENGDADRAAFIRIQVELARLEATGQAKSLAVDHLRAKERAFLGPLSVYRQLWAAEGCPELVRVVSRGGRGALEAMTVEGADRLTWRRGFVERVECSAAEWGQHGPAIRKRNPVRELYLVASVSAPLGEWWVRVNTLRGLSRVVLNVADFPGGTSEWFLRWLRERLPGVVIDADG